MARKTKVKEPEKENGERWLVTYSDLITLLLCFFIILYAKAAADAGGESKSVSAMLQGITSAFSSGQNIFQGAGPSIIDGHAGTDLMSEEALEEKYMEAIEADIENISNMYNLGDSVEVTIDEDGIHIRIKDTVLFDSGEYAINPSSMHIMTKIGDVIKKLSNNYIRIDGHTDNLPINDGIIASNWELGSLRAVNVAKILIEKCALNPKFISAISYGEFRPVDTNSTPEGRANNRRVEITILRNYPK